MIEVNEEHVLGAARKVVLLRRLVPRLDSVWTKNVDLLGVRKGPNFFGFEVVKAVVSIPAFEPEPFDEMGNWFESPKHSCPDGNHVYVHIQPDMARL